MKSSGLVFILLLLCSTAFGRPHLDLYAGGAIADTDDTTLRPYLQATAAYKFDNGLSLGAVFSESTKEEELGRFEYVLKALEVSYYFDRWSKGVYVALRAGLVDVETELSGTEFKTNPFGWGWYVGRDYEVNGLFTAGFDVGFLSVNGDEGLVGASTQTLEKFVSYSLMASLKLWF